MSLYSYAYNDLIHYVDGDGNSPEDLSRAYDDVSKKMNDLKYSVPIKPLVDFGEMSDPQYAGETQPTPGAGPEGWVLYITFRY